MPDSSSILNNGVSYARSPLGIIALFIVSIYAIAGLVFGVAVSTEKLQVGIQWLFALFVVLFPLVVFLVFAYLVVAHHTKLFGPGDFQKSSEFLEFQRRFTHLEDRSNELEAKSNKLEGKSDLFMQAVGVAVPEPTSPTLTTKPTSVLVSSDMAAPVSGPQSDPEKGQWGGHRQSSTRKIVVESASWLSKESGLVRIQLAVMPSDPGATMIEKPVEFHLHPTFDPRIRLVSPIDGVARLTLIAWGAFTVGVRADDGSKLELDLADDDVPAPAEFKAR